ncbi:MAG: glycosyltransferase family 39 protein [Desulfobacteraceae bacterium]|jgi:4-amino-4-deoxy-L-arabinose transferase-like glycosyltransferase
MISIANRILSFSKPATFKVGIFFILLLAIWVAFSGLNKVPLGSHEAFVVQTAKEMSHRNDWIVPTLGGNLRLNKPPLSYWATAGFVRILGAKDFLPWHGRLPSALAGVAMVALTIFIGWRLWGRSIGLIAGILALSNTGFSVFTHSARPEMLYTLFCTLQTALFLQVWRGKTGQKWAAWGMWAAMGAATLTKGPHIPLVMLVAFILVFARTDYRRALRLIRPVTGSVLLIAIAAPWWILLGYKIGWDTLGGSQLTGARYELNFLNVFHPFFYYSGWQLLIPWMMLWPTMLLLVFKFRRMNAGARQIGIVILISFLMLGFGGRKRLHYILPFMSLACVWMAFAVRRFFGTKTQHQTFRSWIVPGHIFLAAGCIIYLWVYQGVERFAPIHPVQCTLALFLLAGLYGAVTIIGKFDGLLRIHRYRLDFLAIAFCFIILLSTLTLTGMGHPIKRWNRARVGRSITQYISSDTPVYTFQSLTPSILIYYANRPINSVNKADDLKALVAQSSNNRIAVVVSEKDLKKVDDTRLNYNILATIENCKDGFSWHLLLFS